MMEWSSCSILMPPLCRRHWYQFACGQTFWFRTTHNVNFHVKCLEGQVAKKLWAHLKSLTTALPLAHYYIPRRGSERYIHITTSFIANMRSHSIQQGLRNPIRLFFHLWYAATTEIARQFAIHQKLMAVNQSILLLSKFRSHLQYNNNLYFWKSK